MNVFMIIGIILMVIGFFCLVSIFFIGDENDKKYKERITMVKTANILIFLSAFIPLLSTVIIPSFGM